MERLPCEFSLIRYVPDVVKGEFVNIGVVLREAGQASGRTAVRFTRDWRRVRCVDADADIGLLEGMEQEFRGRLESGTSVREPKGLMEVLEDTLSNAVQITEGKATLAENMAAQMDELMRMYVEPMRVPRERGKSPRASILGAMRQAFEGVGVWGLMSHGIRASTYTQAGDPLRLDCGYRVKTSAEAVTKVFQAISLGNDVEAAKGLAFSASYLREGFLSNEGARLELTAIIEPRESIGALEDTVSDAVQRYVFGKTMMEDQAIRVRTVANMGAIAGTAKDELLEM